MMSFHFHHVCLESVGVHFPSHVLSSSDIEKKLAPVYERLQLPQGTLERLTAVKTRRMWDTSVTPSSVATIASRVALEKCGFSATQLGAVINCSVSRDFFEPATACLVHQNLGVPEASLAMDITNACIGFTDGLIMLSHLIESGAIKAGIICSGENIAKIVDTTMIQLLKDPEISRELLLKMLPTMTLGCGAAAAVLCHESLSRAKHRIVGGVSRSATQHSKLCVGNADFSCGQGDEIAPIMTSDSTALMSAAAKLGGRTFEDFSETLGWTKDTIDHVFCHQVGRQVNEDFYVEMGLDFAKEFSIYQNYGNMVSAALPSALAIGLEQKPIQQGQKVLLTAFGSGLNARFIGLEW